MPDLRLALRRLVAQPGFAAVAIGTLALGIGANAAIFSVVRAVLLAPLPYAAPDELVRVVGFDADDGLGNLSPADFLDFARETRAFARLGAHGFVGSATISGPQDDAERVGMVRVTETFFPTLGVSPALGRPFTADEDRPNAPRVALISHGFWLRRFAASPAIVGDTLRVNAEPYTVVGVLPASYRHLEEDPDRSADVFLPYGFDPVAANRGAHFIRAVGRLAAGTTIEQARGDLEAIARRLEQAYPESNQGQGVQLAPLHEAVVGGVRRSLLVLAGAVGLVLLIACANLANLLLAAGAGRQREFAVRTALGAARGRLIRQLLAESLVLSALGAIGGVALAAWGTRAATLLAAARIPRSADIAIDGTVLAFTAAIAAVTALLCGLAPALHLSAASLHAALQEGGRTLAAALPHRLRQGFIAAQVALALMLLVVPRCSCAACGRCRRCRLASARPRSRRWTCRCRSRATRKVIRFRSTSGWRSAWRRCPACSTSAPSTSCRSAPATTAGASRSKTTRSRWGSRRRWRAARRRPATSRRWACRCCAAGCSTPATARRRRW
jgi:predicted permease